MANLNFRIENRGISKMEEPRGTRKEEFNQVIKLVNYVFRESSNGPPNMEKWYPLLFNDNNLENMRIIWEDGRLVSHLGISESEIAIYGCKTKIGGIGAVCTHPEYRKRGFASLLLEDGIKKMDKDGIDIALVSGERNLYKRAGCVEVGRVHKFRISGNDLKSFDTEKVKVFPYQEENLENIVQVYQKEAVRFFRSLQDFKRILTTGAAMDREAEILTVHKGDEFLGYLAIQTPAGKEGEKRIGQVVEYSGTREAIIDAVGCVFERYTLQELTFNVPFHDSEFIYLLSQKNLISLSESIPGLVKIINLPRLMDRLGSYIEERLGRKKRDSLKFDQQGTRFSISINQEQFNTDVKRLTQIVLGRHDKKEKEMIPREGEIGKVLVDIFPLPFVWPGLNYV